MTLRFRRSRSGQGGFTAVEMIVTLVVGAFVSGAMVSIFLVLSRVQGVWEQQAQARAIGLTAQETIAQDIRGSAVVIQTGSCQLGNCSPLKLQSVGFSADPGPASPCTVYQLEAGADPTLPTLVRRVFDSSGKLVSRSVVAHGVLKFVSSVSGRTVTISMSLGQIGLGLSQPVPVSFRTTQRVRSAEDEVQGC